MVNPRIGSLPNPFTNAEVLGSGITYAVYARTLAERGNPERSMSRGELCEFARCPHRWLMGYETEETKQTEWGEIIDCLILTPRHFETRFAVTPEKYPKNVMECPQCGSQSDSLVCRKCDQKRVPVTLQKDWDWNATYCKEWREEQSPKTPVKHETATQAQNAAKFLLDDREIQILLNGAQTQVMVVGEYEDEETGLTIPVKALLDIVPASTSTYGKCLADLKTCTSAALFPWTKTVFNFDYHVQAAFYLDLYVAATGEDRTDWLHVCSESFPPWETGKRLLSAEFVELGRLKYILALRRYAKCLKTGVWPGYDTSDNSINGWTLVQPEAWMAQ